MDSVLSNFEDGGGLRRAFDEGKSEDVDEIICLICKFPKRGDTRNTNPITIHEAFRIFQVPQ
jgi:hypothetical protein